MKQYRAVIIGCGNIFPMHAVSVKSLENVKLAAVCDTKEDRARKRAEDSGCPYYLDYKDMIDRENPDVVHICTPHYLHAPIAVYAAEKRLHVMTEKPMSITLEDAKEMVDAAKRNGVSLGVIFQNRYNAGSILIKKALEAGDLGRIKSAKAILTWDRSDEYYSKSDWKGTWDKEGGGVIIDQAIHTLDLMRWFINDRIDYIDAGIGNRAHHKIDVEDVAEGVIRYKNGIATSFYTINYYTYDAPTEIEIHCEKGTARLIGSKGSISFNDGRTYAADQDPNEFVEYGNVKSYWGTSHLKQIRQFYDSLAKGSKPEIDGEEALKTQEMICAIYMSGKEKRKVFL